MTNDYGRIPKVVSKALQQGLAAFPHRSVQQVINATPQTPSQWRTFIHATNSEQKKKVKMMRKQLDVSVTLTEIAGVRVRKLTPRHIAAEFKDSLYIDVHGGAYILFGGLPSIEEGLVIAARLGIVVYSVDYRLPPAHPFPAALNDVESVYQSLLATEPDTHIFAGGTSAGGGLVLALVQRLVRQQRIAPLAIYAGTPWADLTKTSDSLSTNEGIDAVLVTYEGQLQGAAELYANKHDLTDPAISPLYGDFSEFPPTLLVTGTRDLLLSDTVRVNRRIREAGGVTQLEVFEGMAHAQYLVFYKTPESEAVYTELKRFFVAILDQKRTKKTSEPY